MRSKTQPAQRGFNLRADTTEGASTIFKRRRLVTADTKVASQEKTRPQQEGTGASGAVLGQSLGHLPSRLPSSHLRPPPPPSLLTCFRSFTCSALPIQTSAQPLSLKSSTRPSIDSGSSVLVSGVKQVPVFICLPDEHPKGRELSVCLCFLLSPWY